MKTLSHLQNEAIERFNQKLELREEKGGFTYLYEGRDELSSEAIKNFLKTELETIVKESFKNTRVEKDRAIYGGVLNSSEGDRQRKWGQQEGYNQALSDKYDK